MSYNIGQFRRTQLALSKYSSNLSYNIVDYQHDDVIDKAIETASLKKDSSYYLIFSVKQTAAPQSFNLFLWNNEKQIKQSLDSYIVTRGSGETIFEIAFTPNSSYDKVVLALSSRDLTNAKDVLDIEIKSFYEIVNVIDTLKSIYPDLKDLKKLGIQGSAGMTILINGEPIKIGCNNIYELEDENIKVTSLGFVLKENSFWTDGYDQFILDFVYDDKEE